MAEGGNKIDNTHKACFIQNLFCKNESVTKGLVKLVSNLTV